MKIQRIKSFEPLIFPINQKFYIISNYPSSLIPTKYSNKKEKLNKDEKSSLYLEFQNIGQGIAKDISVSVNWNCRFKDYFTELQIELSKVNIEIEMDITMESCWINTSKENKINIGGNYPFKSNTNSSFDYLLPIHNGLESCKIEIPSAIEIAWSLTILLLESTLSTEKQKKIILRMKEFSIPLLQLKYKDNLGKSYTKDFLIALENIGWEMTGKSIDKIFKLTIERTTSLDN